VNLIAIIRRVVYLDKQLFLSLTTREYR